MKLKLTPILKMLTVTVTVAIIIYYINTILQDLPNYETLMIESSWIFADLVHAPQFLIPIIIILYITKGRPSLYGFNLRQDQPEFTHNRMLLIGICSGLLISIKYIIQIVNGIPVDIPQPVTPTNIFGYMTFQWIIVGLSEETMFRGLIQTYLMKNLEGEINLAGHRFHIGTIIAAIFWGGFHIINALNMPMSIAVFTVVITTPIGLLMGYAYQRTGSLLTTILVHNSLFGVPLLIGYILYFMGY
ncbi:lysostaphin resistance A-like protein [Thermoproteota archaeon]